MRDTLKNVRFSYFLCLLSLLLFLLMTLTFYCGMRHSRDQVRRRAIKIIDKNLEECYSNQDIEIIVFGEIQE